MGTYRRREHLEEAIIDLTGIVKPVSVSMFTDQL
jgi:hypothetical protein